MPRVNELTTWINTQLTDRGWGYNELARRAGVASGTVSNIMSGRTNPGFVFCRGVARALGVEPDRVMRIAGLLPSLPPAVEGEQEAIRLLRRLSSQARENAMAMLRGLAGARRPATAMSEERAGYGDGPCRAAEGEADD